MAAPDGTPHLPGRHPIDGYGAGGFRFAEMSHRGSILALPSGIWAWPVRAVEEMTPAAFERVFSEAGEIDLFVLGTGAALRPLPEALRGLFRERGIAVEVMATGYGAHTFNILLAENRRVAAGLIAVD